MSTSADQTGPYRALHDAAVRAIDAGAPLWLVTHKDDLEPAERWGLIVALLEEGVPGHELARAVDGVPALHIVAHPETCSMGRVRHYYRALRQILFFRKPGKLRCFMAPQPDLESPAAVLFQWRNGCGLYDLALDGLSEKDLIEVDPLREDNETLSAASEAISILNRQIAAVIMGGDFRVAREVEDEEGVLRVEFMKKDAAQNFFANHFWEDADGKRHSTFGTWMTSVDRNQFPSVIFRPEPPDVPPIRVGRPTGDPDEVRGEPKPLNLWRGWRYEPSDERGTYELFKRHWVENIACGHLDTFRWQWNWVAQMVREPHRKLGTAIALRGGQGAGKTVWAAVIGHLMHPAHYIAVEKADQLTGRFNKHLGTALLVSAEEAVWAGDHAAKSALKHLVTAPRLRVEPKGVDSFEVPNHVRLIFTSNENWVVPAEFDERRFAVFDVGNGWKGEKRKFADMMEELECRRGAGYEALLHDLMYADLGRKGGDKRNEYLDPAVIPVNQALLDQKLRGLDTVGRWWADRLSAGCICDDEWPAEFSADGLHERYAEATKRRGAGKVEDSATFGKRLRELAPGPDGGGSLIVRRRSGRGGRRYVYQLPPLAQARAALERHLGGPIPWPDEE